MTIIYVRRLAYVEKKDKEASLVLKNSCQHFLLSTDASKNPPPQKKKRARLTCYHVQFTQLVEQKQKQKNRI